MKQRTSGRRRVLRAGWCAVLTGTLLLVHPVAVDVGGAAMAAAGAAEGPLEQIRGIYRQRAIEIATVGARTVRLTPMTRFRRCGRFRGRAQDFNDHLVEVTGREVEGVGFVAGFVNAIEGCSPAVGDGHGSNEHGMGMP